MTGWRKRDGMRWTDGFWARTRVRTWTGLGCAGLMSFALAGCGLFDSEADKLEKLLGRVTCSDSVAAEYAAARGDTLGLGKKSLMYRLRHKGSPRLNTPARVFWEELTISADFAQLDPSSIESDQVGTCTIVSVFCRPAEGAEGRNYCVAKHVAGPNLDNTRYEERVDFFIADQENVAPFRERLHGILEKRGG